MTETRNMKPGEVAGFNAAVIDAPRSQRTARVYGVDYTVFDWPQWGELYVTECGLTRLEHLHPTQWYADRRYFTAGERLEGATGMVYRVPTLGVGDRRQDLVVKFSRFAQDVPLYVSDTLPPNMRPTLPEHLQFNSPFEEFGNLADLRRGQYGPSDLRILTKRPLAIFKTHEQFPLWQLGRARHAFRHYQHAQRLDQLTAGQNMVEDINIDRIYITLFEWVKGIDAEACVEQGLLTTDEMEALYYRVQEELAAKGYYVLDHKPRHIILRPTAAGGLLRRHGQPVYAIIDFELMLRTEPYEAWRSAQKDNA